MISSQKLPIPFACGIAALVFVLLAMCLMAASQESFIRDDFAFLAYVQRPHWSWAEVYLPIDERWWWAYRPLGMETYFYLCFQLFGLDAFGYYGVAIALHFATGWLAWRLMLRLGFEPRVAAVGAVLAISRYPAMHDIFYGSVFHYIAAIFFSLLAINCFIDHLRDGGAARLAASCGFLVLALLCNEFAVVLPGVLGLFLLYERRFSPSPDVVKELLVKTGPALAIASIYCVYRFFVIADVEANHAYVQSVDPALIAHNLSRQIFLLFGDTPSMLVAGGIFFGALAIAAARADGRELLRARMAPIALTTIGWMLAVMAPFSVLMVTHSRFSKPIEVPASILFAASLDVLWRLHVHGARWTRHVEVALLLLVMISLPYGTLLERRAAPIGVHGQELAAAIREHAPEIAPNTRVVVIYNAPGLASHAGGAKFKRETFGGTAALQAYFSDKMLKLELHDLWRGPVDRRCRNCVYLQLMPGLALERAKPRFLRFESPYPEVRP